MPRPFKSRARFKQMAKAVAVATAAAVAVVVAWAAAVVAPAAPCVWLQQHPQPSVPIELQSLVPAAAVQLAVRVEDQAQWDALACTPMTCQERPAQPWFGSLINDPHPIAAMQFQIKIPHDRLLRPTKLVNSLDERTCVVTDDSRTICWGSKARGVLGVPESIGDPFNEAHQPIEGLTEVPTMLAGGSDFTCALFAPNSPSTDP